MRERSPSGTVLDASAVLALLREEPGAGYVESILPAASISAVNVSEILQRAAKDDFWEPGLDADLESLGVKIESFDVRDARVAAAIWEAAPNAGLSLGDRACLALAQRLELPAVTTDQVWTNLDIGVDVIDARSAG